MKSADYQQHDCDRCARVGHAWLPATLPPGWRSDPYSGKTLCDACVDKDAGTLLSSVRYQEPPS